MQTTTLLDLDQQLLACLMDKLGYEPIDRGGIQLRGFYNPDGSLRWVWPASLRQPLFLSFYNASSPKAQLFCALIQLAFAFRLSHWLFPLLPGRFANTNSRSWPSNKFALFTGTPGPYRKAVCCYSGPAGGLTFAKLPLTVDAVHKVQAEAQALQALAKRPSTSFCVPEVVEAQPGFLLQRSVKPAQACRANQLTLQHVAYLREQRQVTTVYRLLSETNFWHTLQNQVVKLQALPNTRIPFGLRTKLMLLFGRIDPSQVLPLTFAHGDFTPWNCWLSHNQLALYDLEFALEEAPLLYDLFHFHVQQGLLVSRQPAAQLRKLLWQKARTHFPELAEEQLHVALQLYLLHQVSGYALIYHAQEQWHAQVQWLLAGWNELLSLELAAEVEHRQLCLYDLLDGLPARGGVVLKQRADNAYYPSATSDVDLLLTRPQVMASVDFLRRFPLVRSAAVRRQAHMVSVDCFFRDGSFLSVDLLHQVLRKGVQMLDPAEVLAHARTTAHGVPVPALRHDFEYTWLFYWLNGSDLPAVHRQHFQRCSTQEQQELLEYLVDKYELHFENVECVARYRPLIAQQLRVMLGGQPANNFFSLQWRNIRYALNTLASFFRPNGFVITFSGVDGAGKSTIIEHVKERLEKKWRKRVVVIRHRPSVLPILSAWKYGKANAEQRAVQTLPRQGDNQNLVASLIRFGYYYLDYLLGQAVVWLKYTRRGIVVLYDRYYFDFINDSRRSNICLPEQLTRGLYAFVNKPRLNFFLYADPEEILRRKQELSGDTIRELTQKYQTLFGQLAGQYRQSQYVSIENNNLDATLALIGRYIQKEIQ